MKPRYGYGFFSVDSSGEFRQKILFFYWDPDEELYYSVSTPQGRKLEIETMRKNMQTFLDLEKILVNKKEVKARVAHVEIGFLSSTKRPYVEFLIFFRGNVSEGINLYENHYEKEKVEYDYRVMWVFPENFKITRAEFGFPHYFVDERIIYFDVKKGSEVPGYEFIEFLVL
ncbi:MAG: hypothetical protein RMH84_05915 [Sulfolobales archaeon]|nr:hypothetical protein [Sulfolobales archaeon]MCX8208272.1 hypothetical protein [Sulfolobales archaeon]MDW8011109.1 hypothetical protein [Sulfolobales archaeon]